MGSVKQTWKTLSLSLVTSGEEADGVSMKVRSAFVWSETVKEAPVVVGPTRTCIPSSIMVL